MAATIRGIQPLQFGVTVTDGYVTENLGTDSSTEELVIEDEIGDIITQITGFGVKHDVTLEVIPKSAATKPAPSEIFTYGSGSIVVLHISEKQVRKDVMKWTIKGMIYAGVAPND